MNEYDFILQDRIAKIQAINNEYDLEHNAYISFSGGKDSVVVSKLIDLAIPNNKIPRVFINTGIEYIDMVKYVRERAKNDDRIIILNSGVKIKPTLEKVGYPFKSKEFSLRVQQFNKGSNANFIHKYLTGWDMNNGKQSKFVCPKCLLYIFSEKGKYNYSDRCCYELKKKPSYNWSKANHKSVVITGMRNDEGGNRERLSCISHKKGQTMFHPIIVVDEKWENEFVERERESSCVNYTIHLITLQEQGVVVVLSH